MIKNIIQSVIKDPSAVFSTTPIHNSSSLQNDKLKIKLDDLTQKKHVMVFSGFSGLGYSDYSKLKENISSILEEAVKRNGAHNLCVAAGATSDGIGIVYEIVKSLDQDIMTLGIVSEQARGTANISQSCDHVLYVNQSDSSWKVLDEAGKSYMVYIATQKDEISRTGEYLAFGGGKVTLSELKEAEKAGLNPKIYPNFEPSPEKVASMSEKDPLADLTPVRNVYQNRD